MITNAEAAWCRSWQLNAACYAEYCSRAYRRCKVPSSVCSSAAAIAAVGRFFNRVLLRSLASSASSSTNNNREESSSLSFLVSSSPSSSSLPAFVYLYRQQRRWRKQTAPGRTRDAHHLKCYGDGSGWNGPGCIMSTERDGNAHDERDERRTRWLFFSLISYSACSHGNLHSSSKLQVLYIPSLCF